MGEKVVVRVMLENRGYRGQERELKVLKRLAASAPTSQMLSVLDEDGGVIVEGLFAKSTIAEMLEGVENASERFAPGGATQGMGQDGKGFVGANTIRFSGLGKLSPAFFEMLDNEIYRQIADAVLLPNCGSYWVNSGPGHADRTRVGGPRTASRLHELDAVLPAAVAELPRGDAERHDRSGRCDRGARGHPCYSGES